jgi:hypothetical protein
MSDSFSSSGSFSSSYALVQHFDELVGVLADRGFAISEHAWTTIERCIQEEELGWVAFYGVDDAGNGHACARMSISWDEHRVIVEGGDDVTLPIDEDGEVILRRVRRIGHHFMDFVSAHALRPVIRCGYRAEVVSRSAELDRKYGWTSAPPVQRAPGATDAIAWESDYHRGVTFTQYYAG